MKRAGLKEDYIQHFLEDKISQQVTGIIEAAERAKVAPGAYAQRIAEERFGKAKASAEGKNFSARILSFALELYRQGVIPYQLVTPVASRYFEKRFTP
jgi:hypothetical protein